MTHLISKDEEIMASAPIMAFTILNYMKLRQVKQISVFDIADHFGDEKWFTPKSLYFAMIFLFSLGLINFDKTYITANA